VTKLHLNGQPARFDHVTNSAAIEQDKHHMPLATMDTLDALGLGFQYRIKALKRPRPTLVSDSTGHEGVLTNKKAHRIDPYVFTG
jgi:hypothetical protein